MPVSDVGPKNVPAFRTYAEPAGSRDVMPVVESSAAPFDWMKWALVAGVIYLALSKLGLFGGSDAEEEEEEE